MRLNGFNVYDKRIYFEDKVTLAPFDQRFELLNILINKINKDDVLVITSFDCLGDNFNEFYNKFKFIIKKGIRLICMEYSLEVLKNKDFEFFFIIYKNFRNFYNQLNRKCYHLLPLESHYIKKEDIFIKFQKGSSFVSLSREYFMSEKLIQEVIQYHNSKACIKNSN